MTVLVRRYVSFLTPATLLSWPVVIVSTIWLAILHFSDARVVSSGVTSGRIIAFLAAQGTLVGLLWLGCLAIRRMTGARLTVATIGVVLIAAAGRGAVFGSVLAGTGIQGVRPLGFFVATSLVNASLAVSLSAIAVGEVRAHRVMTEGLRNERDRLQAMNDQATLAVRRVDEVALSAIEADLRVALAPLESDDPARMRATLRAAIDDVARPMSRAFEAPDVPWQPQPAPPSAGPVDWMAALRDSLQPQALRPLATGLTIGLLALPSSLVYNGIAITVVIVGYAVASAVIALSIARALAQRLVGSRSGWSQPLGFLAGLAAGSVLMVAGSVPVLARTSQPGAYLLQGPALIILVGSLLALVDVARARASAVEESLAQAGEDLRWSLTRMRETERQHRRALAHALHGRVQATLSAALLRVSQEEHNPQDWHLTAEAIRAEVALAIDNLRGTLHRTPSMDEVVERTLATWAGIASISVDIDTGLLECVKRDEVVAGSLADLIPELCFNAVKHASASEIRIEAGPVDSRWVRLSVTNDGDPPRPSPAGLGDKLLDCASTVWNRGRTGSWTVTEALLPLASR